MSTLTVSSPSRETQTPRLSPREVVAVVLEWRGRVALLKRSQLVGYDRGRWHCITGYLESGASPQGQAFEELREEAGLAESDLLNFRQGEPLLLADEEGHPWLVHTFMATTSRRRLVLNNEHDCFRWATPSKVGRFVNRVTWLDDVLDAAQVRYVRGETSW